jgi:hypothetical protein
MSDQLKSCPFCGGKAEIITDGLGEFGWCLECGIFFATDSGNLEEEWNRRVEPYPDTATLSDSTVAKVGDEVWNEDTGHCIILAMDGYQLFLRAKDAIEYHTMPAGQLLSTKPDSWEKLERDLGHSVCEELARAFDVECDGDLPCIKCTEMVAAAAINRAKALAKVEQ